MSITDKDTYCTDSLRSGVLVTGAVLIAQAIYRRLTTPRGMLRGGEEEADYGIDITGLVGSAIGTSSKASIAGRIRTEVLKDARILECTVDITESTDGIGTSWIVVIDCTSDEGPFDLSLAVSAVTLELLGINA